MYTPTNNVWLCLIPCFVSHTVGDTIKQFLLCQSDRWKTMAHFCFNWHSLILRDVKQHFPICMSFVFLFQLTVCSCPFSISYGSNGLFILFCKSFLYIKKIHLFFLAFKKLTVVHNVLLSDRDHYLLLFAPISPNCTFSWQFLHLFVLMNCKNQLV